MNTFGKDIRYALRSMRRSPGFTAVVVLTLALGIGATAAIFSVVDGVLLRPLPYPEPDAIVRVFEVGEEGGRSNFSHPNFEDVRAQTNSFAALAEVGRGGTVSAIVGGQPMRIAVQAVSHDFVTVLGVSPAVGRTFSTAERQPGGRPAVIISHGLWRRRLGGGAALESETLEYDGRLFDVVGVMPRGFDFPAGTDAWVPRELWPATGSRTALNWRVYGRLDAGVSLERAQRELSALADRLRARHGSDTWMVDAAVVPLKEQLVGHARPALLVLLGAAGALLLIACVNVINLLLARATSRQRELAVRRALGAGRARVVQQFVAESAVVAFAGGALGVILALVGVDALLALEPGRLPRVEQVGVDWRVLAFALGVSMLTALGLGLGTAFRATRAGVRSVLAEGGRTQAGAPGAGARDALVASQIALTLVLLIGAGLLGRSFLRLTAVDPGFRTDPDAVTMTVAPSSPGADADRSRLIGFHTELRARLEALPGVDRAGGVNAFPMLGSGANGTFLILDRPDEVADWDDWRRIADNPERTGSAHFRVADEGYFRAMGIPLRRGRLFDERDHARAPHVAVISRSLAERRWPDEDPLGTLIQFGNMDGDLRPFTIVGVVGDVRDRGLDSQPRPTFYANVRQRPSTGGVTYLLHGGEDPATVIASARRVVRELAPTVPPRFATVGEVFSDVLADRRFTLLLLALFAAAALTLAVLGIYGVVAYSVSRRTRELGIRLALGARGGAVARLVVLQGAKLVAVGLVVGVPAAVALTRFIGGLLYGVEPTDPLTYAGVGLLLAAAALLASWIPARRATRTDPMVALRGE